MAARILRRPKAVVDAEEIANFIANDSLQSALRFLANAELTLQRLAEFPGIGSPFLSEHPQLQTVRACRIEGFPHHIVFYFEHADAIEVIRVLHGARNLESELLRS